MKKSTKILSIALMFFGLGAFAQAPVANFSVSPNPACQGKTVQCTDMSTGSPTAWGYTSSGATPSVAFVQNPIFTYSAAGVYTIGMLCSNVSGTSAVPAVQSVSVLAYPSVTITPSSTLIGCPGVSLTLTGSGANTYSWAAPTSTNASVAITPTANTTYSVLGTGVNGCSWWFTHTRSVTPNPLSVTSTTNNLCAGQTATLTASGGTAYTWAPVTSTIATAAVSPTVTSNYTVSSTGTTCPSWTWTAVFTQSVQNCPSGIQKNAASGINFNLYPNPTNGDFTIELNNGLVKTVEILDMTGRMVYTNTTTSDKINCNLNSLAKGIYYVRVQSNNTVEIAKIVKQ